MLAVIVFALVFAPNAFSIPSVGIYSSSSTAISANQNYQVSQSQDLEDLAVPAVVVGVVRVAEAVTAITRATGALRALTRFFSSSDQNNMILIEQSNYDKTDFSEFDN